MDRLNIIKCFYIVCDLKSLPILVSIKLIIVTLRYFSIRFIILIRNIWKHCSKKQSPSCEGIDLNYVILYSYVNWVVIIIKLFFKLNCKRVDRLYNSP